MRWFFGVIVTILVLCFLAVPLNLAHCEAQAHAMKNGDRCGMFTIKEGVKAVPIKTYKTIGAAKRAAKDRYPIIRVNGGYMGGTEALYIVPVEGSADIDLLGTDGRYVATVVDICSRAPFITTAPCSGPTPR